MTFGGRVEKPENGSVDPNLEIFVVYLVREMCPPERHYAAAQTQDHRKRWAAGRMKFRRLRLIAVTLWTVRECSWLRGRLPPWLGARPGVIPGSS